MSENLDNTEVLKSQVTRNLGVCSDEQLLDLIATAAVTAARTKVYSESAMNTWLVAMAREELLRRLGER